MRGESFFIAAIIFLILLFREIVKKIVVFLENYGCVRFGGDVSFFCVLK